MDNYNSGTVDGQQGVAVTWKGLVVFLLAVWFSFGICMALDWLEGNWKD